MFRVSALAPEVEEVAMPSTPVNGKAERAKTLAAEGRSKPEIAKVLASEFGVSVTVAQVKGWLDSGQASIVEAS